MNDHERTFSRKRATESNNISSAWSDSGANLDVVYYHPCCEKPIFNLMSRRLPAIFTFLVLSIFTCVIWLNNMSMASMPFSVPPDRVNAGLPDTLPATVQYNFRHYSLAEGLASKETYGIFVDRRQLVWIGTYGAGAYCYNGSSFTSYTQSNGLPSDIVWDFDEDKDGNILIATDKGVVRFDGKRFDTIATKDSLGVGYCWSVKVDHTGNIWIGTAGGGLFRYNGKTFKNFTKGDGLASNHIWNIIEDRNNNIWIAMNRGGIAKISGDEVTQMTDSTGLQTLTVRCLLEDSHGDIWAASLKGVYRYDGEKFTVLTKKDGLSGDGVTCVYEDRYGNYWFTCHHAGLAMLNATTDEWTRYTQAEGLSGSETWCVTSDRNGNIWVSTNDNGISKYEESAFTHYLPLNDGSVYAAIRASDGTMWVGTDKGLIHLTRDNYFIYTTKQGLIGNYVSALEEDSAHNIWIGTSTGLSMFDGKSFYNYTVKQGLGGIKVNAIATDNNGDVWVGCNRGLHRLHNGFVTRYLEADGLSHYFIHHIRYDNDGRLWIGTFGGGVDCFDPDVIDESPDAIQHITDAQGLTNENTICTLRDRSGDTWISTMADGLNILQSGWESEPDTSKWISEKITLKDGLSSNMITSLIMDGEGNVWAGSANGLNKISGIPGKREIKQYLGEEGFTGIACAQNVAFRDVNDRICFGSGEFVSSYDSRLDIPDTVTPLLHITSVKLFFEEVNWDSVDDIRHSAFIGWYHLPDNLVLPYDKNHVTISFTGITHNDAEAVTYQWKLVGSEDDWNPVTDKREATYSNLPAGSYTFTVRSANADGIWNETPATFAFEIRPPFWATWWFRTSGTLAVIMLLYISIRWRFRALEARKRELEQVVEERTAEVVQQKQEILDSINYAKHLQEALLPSAKTVKELLGEAFVLFLPKDIVAGDFYWIEKRGDYTFVAAGDCTGHGVPGAMVSVVCSNALNSAVKEFHLTDPGKILDKVRELVVSTFEKSESEVMDGMDISLAVINSGSDEILWAGANNPLWIVSGEMRVLPPDKQPVGKSYHQKPFTTQKFTTQKGDLIYLFTDGYADQFGGPKGKKFKYKPLQELLLTVRDQSMQEQEEALRKAFSDWQGNLEQVDDVLILGIRR